MHNDHTVSPSSSVASGHATPFAGARAADVRRAVIAATIGNVMEWYDFAVYGFLSVSIATLFFLTGNELTSLLLTVGIVGVGFCMRPVGAIVLGSDSYSDRRGRRAGLADYVIDFHAGGNSLDYLPTLFVERPHDASQCARLDRIIDAFAPPRALFFDLLGEDRVIGAAARRQDKFFMTGESGRADSVNLAGLDIIRKGVRGLMNLCGRKSGDWKPLVCTICSRHARASSSRASRLVTT
jgi:hypothetical protein